MLQINQRTHLIKILILSRSNQKLPQLETGKLPNLLHHPVLPNKMSGFIPSAKTQGENTTHSKNLTGNKKEENASSKF